MTKINEALARNIDDPELTRFVDNGGEYVELTEEQRNAPDCPYCGDPDGVKLATCAACLAKGCAPEPDQRA